MPRLPPILSLACFTNLPHHPTDVEQEAGGRPGRGRGGMAAQETPAHKFRCGLSQDMSKYNCVRCTASTEHGLRSPSSLSVTSAQPETVTRPKVRLRFLRFGKGNSGPVHPRR